MQSTRTHWSRDGWDARFRLGVVVPHADIGPEAELQAMAPKALSIHAARLHFSAMRAGGDMDETIAHDPVASFTQPPHIDEAVHSLCAAPLNAVALAFTSSAYKHGLTGESSLVERLRAHTRGMPIYSTCLSAARAMCELEPTRIALVHPPWFDAELDLLGGAYFKSQGHPVVHHAPCGLPSGQIHITPQRLYDWIRKIIAFSHADCVFVGGNGQRAVGVIEAVEASTGVTMLSANQVILWDALRGFDVGREMGEVRGYGRIFQTGRRPG